MKGGIILLTVYLSMLDTEQERKKMTDLYEEHKYALLHYAMKISSCVILGNEAFSIIALDDKFDNGVIWNMDGHTFDLWGKIPMDELKKVAESILENK